MQKKSNITKLYLFGFLAVSIYAHNFPVMSELSAKNQIFKQYSQQVELSYKLLVQKKEPPLELYTYTAQKDDTLLKVAARCNISAESIATLNRIASTDTVIAGKTLLLPNVSGIFIVSNPQTDFEAILSKRYFDISATPCYTDRGTDFYFLAGVKLTPTERAFFLDTGLRSPLPQGILTSGYGMRKSPITGKDNFHEGVDFAAPLGTPVFSCRSGIVQKTGFDSVYGKYVILKHEDGAESLYAHLDAILIENNYHVARGLQIGTVGSTGLSTGPHLHFEMRINGTSKNPASVFLRK